MPSKKNKKISQKKSQPRLKGRGDYDFDVEPAKPKGAASATAVAALGKRVANVERKVASGGGAGGPNPYGSVGKDIGSLFGMGHLGEKLGGAVGKFLGHGDYVVSSNSLIPGKASQEALSGANMPPVFTKDGRRGIRVTEREYLGDIRAGTALVSGATTFNNQTFVINPGLASTFPWLSTVAACFEEWEPLGLVFEFRTTSASFNGTSQALGKVIMATDYDPLDQSFTNAIQMEDADYACSSVASESMMHGIECDPKERPSRVYYVRTGSVPSGGTKPQFDLGNFQIATQGMNTAGVTVGELWVSYDIAFYKKELLAGQIGGTNLSWVGEGSGTFSTSAYFGTLASFQQAGSLPVTVTNTTVTFPSWLQAGNYQVIFNWRGNAGAATAIPGVVSLSNCRFINPDQISAGGQLLASAFGNIGTSANSQDNVILTFQLNVTGPSASFTLSGGTLPTSTSAMWVAITQCYGAAVWGLPGF